MVDLHKKEHAFGAFTIGVAVGVGAALLFGTEDGRKMAQKLFDSLPDKIKNLTDQDNSASASVIPGTDPESIPNLQSNSYDLSSTPESTLHTVTYVDRSEALAKDGTPHSYIANNPTTP